MTSMKNARYCTMQPEGRYHYTKEEREEAYKVVGQTVEAMLLDIVGISTPNEKEPKVRETETTLFVKIDLSHISQVEATDGALFGPNCSNISMVLHYLRLQQVLKHNKIINLEIRRPAPNDGLLVVNYNWWEHWIFTATTAHIPSDDFYAAYGNVPTHIRQDRLDRYITERKTRQERHECLDPVRPTVQKAFKPISTSRHRDSQSTIGSYQSDD